MSLPSVRNGSVRARDADNMAMLTLGTGIGGAIVLGGKLFYGMSGMAGEFGHVTIEPNGVPCGCGNHGCAERYASATAVVRMAREAIDSGLAPELAKAASSDPEFSAKAIYNLAIQGNPDAQRIFQRFGQALGILLADLVNILDLDMFVIGGGVVSAWDAFAPRMFSELRERSLVYAASAPEDPTGKKEGASAQIANYTRRKTIITQALLGSDAGFVRRRRDFRLRNENPSRERARESRAAITKRIRRFQLKACCLAHCPSCASRAGMPDSVRRSQCSRGCMSERPIRLADAR